MTRSPRRSRSASSCSARSIGWHFLYEGYFKLCLPGWSRDGAPLAAWSVRRLPEGRHGPLRRLFHRSGRRLPGSAAIDSCSSRSGSLLVGLSLLLGLFTQAGCAGRSLLLALFYVSPSRRAACPEPRREGAYLLVNKNLIEAAAVLVLLCLPDRPDRGSRPAACAARGRPRAARQRGCCVMNLTPEQQALGRRNFLKALAGTPALAALGAAAAVKGPVRGGPVRVASDRRRVGQGRVLLGAVPTRPTRRSGRCATSIPTTLKKADEVLAKNKPAARQPLRRLAGDAREGGHRGRGHGAAALDARRHHGPAASRPANTSSAKR